jgi:hypothetical protein
VKEKFEILRENYSKIVYKDYQVIDEEENIKVLFHFIIPGLCEFKPYLLISKNSVVNDNIDLRLLNSIVFRIGLVELISYYKCVCPKTIEIEAGYIDEYEQKWFKKLFYNGLGEFLHVNKIDISEEDLFSFVVKGEKEDIPEVLYNGVGNLIPIGGGKDSLVTLNLLKDYDNKCFMINPKEVHYNCVGDLESYTIKRFIDKTLLELNSQGFLNGHTPFSAIVAFISYLVAYLSNRKYIVLSNEGSANEPTVIGTNINHQYSKTYEFENDFYEYTKKYFKIDIKYFSLLRPIKEVQIAYLFSKLKGYHNIFRSCNVGSKSNPWIWCCDCPKCLFIFIMLRAFMSKDEVVNIFGENLLDKESLKKDFLELIGESETKPFECIGTIDEVKFAMNRIIRDDESYLSNLYKDNYYEEVNIDLSKIYYENHVEEEYLAILEEAIKDAR